MKQIARQELALNYARSVAPCGLSLTLSGELIDVGKLGAEFTAKLLEREVQILAERVEIVSGLRSGLEYIFSNECTEIVDLIQWDQMKIDDPPDPAYAQVALPRPPARVRSSRPCTNRRLTAASVCRRVLALEERIVSADARLASTSLAQLTAMDRLGSAAHAGDAQSDVLQLTTLRALEIELADGLRARDAASAAFASTVARLHARITLTARFLATAEQRLGAYLARIGVSARVRAQLAASVPPTHPLDYLALVSKKSSAEGRGSLPGETTVADVSALVAALQQQHYLSNKLARLLTTELRQATHPTHRRSALRSFSINATRVHGQAGALLAAAATTLAG